MVRKFFFLALFLMAGTAFLSSCKKEELSSKKEILSLIFEASKNAQLDRNYLGEIVGTEISAELPFGTDLAILIPTMELSPRATLSPVCGVPTDFTNPVPYTVTAEDGTTKAFSVLISTSPAPYLGNWIGGPIDFGEGLMRVKIHTDADGAISMELVELLTSETNTNSMKGYFEPISRQDTDIKVNQTHRWITGAWSSELTDHTMMYHVNGTQSIRFYYSLSYPRDGWWFELNLTRE
ncbi:MAG: hypothetical protein V2A67_10835 [Bacteroidota bacterium]